jgi:DNA-binding NtrC family response regulator
VWKHLNPLRSFLQERIFPFQDALSWTSGMTGFDLQEELCRADDHLPIIFITDYGDIQMGVDAMKKGLLIF